MSKIVFAKCLKCGNEDQFDMAKGEIKYWGTPMCKCGKPMQIQKIEEAKDEDEKDIAISSITCKDNNKAGRH